MPDQEFKIVITGDATSAVAATQQTSDASKKLKVDTSDLSDETRRRLGQLPPLEDAVKKEAKAVEDSSLSHRELRRVLSEIGSTAAPGAGAALAELAYGPVGAALALLSAYELLKKAMDEVSQKADDLDAKELETHRSNIEKVWKAWDDARLKIEAYQTALKEAGEDKDPAATHLKRIQTISEAQTQANLRELEQLGKLEIARLKSLGASPEQLAAAKFANEQAVNDLRDSAANRSAAQIQADLDRRKMRQSDFDATQAAEQNRVMRATDASNRANSALAEANDPAVLKAKQDARDAAAAELARVKAQPDWSVDPITGQGGKVDTSGAMAQAQAALKEKQADVDRMTAGLEAAKKAVQNTESEKQAAEAALKRVTEKGISNQAVIASESDQLDTVRATEAIKQAGEKMVSALTKAQSDIELTAGKSDQIIEEAAKAEDDLKNLRLRGYSADKINADYAKAQTDRTQPGQFTDQDRAAIERYNLFIADKASVGKFQLLLNTLSANSGDLISVVRQHLAGSLTQQQEINDLKVAVSVITNRQRQAAFNSK